MADLDQALSVARIHLKTGRIGDAAAIHHLLSALRPDDAEGWYRLGHALGEIGQDAHAAVCFREVLRLTPGHAGAARALRTAVDIRLDRAAAEEAAGRHGDAVLALGEAVLMNPHDLRPRRALMRLALAAMPEAAILPSMTGQVEKYDEQLRARDLARTAPDAKEVPTHTSDPAIPMMDEAKRLAKSYRLEEAVGYLRRAMPLAHNMTAPRNRLYALKARLTTPGPRIMPGIGTVDISMGSTRCWRFTPEKSRGIALALSMPHLAAADEDDPVLDNHGPWEMRQVVRSLLAAGFIVDVTSFLDPELPPSIPPYDLVYSLHGGIAAIVDRLPASARKIVWLTGSSPDYQNRREIERIDAMAARGRTGYPPNRQMDVAAELASIDLADRCVLLGNIHTLSTFSLDRQAKVTRVMPTASKLPSLLPSRAPEGPPEFLWLGGGGVVLKGLDLALEAFAAMPELILHVVGYAAEEPEFDRLYDRELYRLPNIRFHGFQRTSTPAFAAILARASAVIAPSASEGASTSIATCVSAGLFPIVSDDTGLDYDDGAVIRLSELTVAAISDAVRTVARMPPARLAALRAEIRAKALPLYSRERFARDVDALVGDWAKPAG